MSVRRSRPAATSAVGSLVVAVCALAAGALVDPGAASGAVVGATQTASPPAAGASVRHRTGGAGSLDDRPNLDVRIGAEVRGQTAAERRYATSLGPFASVTAHPLPRTPGSVSRLRGYLTGASPRPAAAIVRGYLRAHAAGLGIGRADLATLRLSSRTTDVHGVVHLSWTQVADGVPVFGNGLRAHVAADGRLLAIQGAPVSGLPALAAAS